MPSKNGSMQSAVTVFIENEAVLGTSEVLLTEFLVDFFFRGMLKY